MNTFMNLPDFLVEKLEAEELVLIKGGNEDKRPANNGDGRCEGVNNGNGRCEGPNNRNGYCGS